MSTHDLNDKQQQAKLIEIVTQTIERDEALREKYGVKNKFRFVRDRLQALLNRLEKDREVKIDKEEKQTSIVVGPDEIVVYVYLFNAHGATLKTWQNMLIPKVFYEYSINRPIYMKRKQIETIIKTKANKNQHGFIAIAIKAADVQKTMQEISQTNSASETLNSEMLKIKEGSLHFSKMISFTHNEIDYIVNENGELIKKV
jgi:hypothetical protein